MDRQEYARRADALKQRLWRTALCYLNDEQAALEAVDSAVYKGLLAVHNLRQPEYFDTWLTRILINECKAEQRRREFTANVSHELKTPLTSIAGYAELIENGMARPEDIKPFAHTIRKQALRLVSLAEDIIQLSQLEENDGEILFEEVNLTELASDCVQSLQINAQSRTVDLHLAAPEAPIYIKGNKSLLEELLYNLCDNAIRYNKPQGSVTVTLRPEQGGTALQVADTGIGIPKKYRERIFERFFRVDKSRSKETGGTGLGLAIVKHIARIHNARIKLDSAVDEGTTITVIFESVNS